MAGRKGGVQEEQEEQGSTFDPLSTFFRREETKKWVGGGFVTSFFCACSLDPLSATHVVRCGNPVGSLVSGNACGDKCTFYYIVTLCRIWPASCFEENVINCTSNFFCVILDVNYKEIKVSYSLFSFWVKIVCLWV